MGPHLISGHSALLPLTGAGLIPMALIPAALVTLAVVAIWQLASATAPRGQRPGQAARSLAPSEIETPETVLADRLVRGEITPEEYRRVLDVLRS